MDMKECLYLSLVTSTSEIGSYPAQHIQHIQYDKQGRMTEHFAGQKTAKHEERGGEKKQTPRLCPYREYSVGTGKNTSATKNTYTFTTYLANIGVGGTVYQYILPQKSP